jgi:hypothetical protein
MRQYGRRRTTVKMNIFQTRFERVTGERGPLKIYQRKGEVMY